VDREPLVSVVIPTYNRADTIGAAVKSALDQTYPRLEIIIVDDGSVDGTAHLIRDLISDASTSRREIRYLYQSNMGQSRARNAGIAAARGEWIAFLDSDDLWLPDKIEWQVRAIERFKKNCGACVSDVRLVNKSNGMETTAFRLLGIHYEDRLGILSEPTVDIAKGSFSMFPQGLVVRSDLARQVGGFDNDLHFEEDHDFLFRLSLVTSYCYVNLPLAIIDRTSRVTDPNARARAWDNAEFRIRARQLMYEKWLASGNELPLCVKTAIIQSLRAVHSAWANLYVQRGQFGLARQAVSTAIKYQFTINLIVKWMLIHFAPWIARKIVPAHRLG